MSWLRLVNRVMGTIGFGVSCRVESGVGIHVIMIAAFEYPVSGFNVIVLQQSCVRFDDGWDDGGPLQHWRTGHTMGRRNSGDVSCPSASTQEPKRAIDPYDSKDEAFE